MSFWFSCSPRQGEGIQAAKARKPPRDGTEQSETTSRVWKYTGAFKHEIKMGLDLGIRGGKDATAMGKDFKFTGWHPHCRCRATTILKTEEEMAEDTERVLAGESIANNFKPQENMDEIFNNGDACQLYLGDCLEVTRRMPDGCADAVICDPPYGYTSCRWDEAVPLAGMWAEFGRLCRGAVVLLCAEPFASELVTSNKNQFKEKLTWVKHYPTRFHDSPYELKFFSSESDVQTLYFPCRYKSPRPESSPRIREHLKFLQIYILTE